MGSIKLTVCISGVFSACINLSVEGSSFVFHIFFVTLL